MTCPGRCRKLIGLAVLVLLLLVYWSVAVSATLDKSSAFDETAHLTAGYSYWRTGDFRLQPENGNLPQRFAAIPLLFSSPSFPETDRPIWQQSNVWLMGYDFFYREGNNPDRLLFQGRATMAMFGLGVALLVYFWSRRLFGPTGALLSLVLCIVCPTMLAHGPLITSDMAAAFFFLAAAGSWWRVLHHISVATVLLCALSLSGLFLAKYSAVLFLPMAFLLLLLRLWGRLPLSIHFGRWQRTVVSFKNQLGCLLAVVFLQMACVCIAIWAAYGFRYAIFADSVEGRDRLHPAGWEHVLPESGAASALVQTARDLHLLPEGYLFGLAFTLHYAQQRPAFFNGEFGTQGWFWFFPYAFLVKTPLPFFVVLGLAVAALIRRWRDALPASPLRSQVWQSFYAAAPLWILLVVYWLAAVHSKLNIGHRHLLPTYPVLFIFAGAAGDWLRFRRQESPDPLTGTGRSKWTRSLYPLAVGIMAMAMVASIVESVRAFPNYLAYFNQIVGGPRQGYRHLVDSSLDWGQDLPGLKRWLDQHVPEQGVPIYFAYFGTGSPKSYGIRARMLPSFFDYRGKFDPAPLQEGVYCISATMLQCTYTLFPGPWNPDYEKRYQLARRYVQMFEYAKKQGAEKKEFLAKVPWPEVFHAYDQLRFGKLCDYLRRREPDAQIGYSILIYRLGADDLREALGSHKASPPTFFWNPK